MIDYYAQITSLYNVYTHGSTISMVSSELLDGYSSDNAPNLTLQKIAIWMSKIANEKKIQFLAIFLHSNGNFKDGQLPMSIVLVINSFWHKTVGLQFICILRVKWNLYVLTRILFKQRVWNTIHLNTHVHLHQCKENTHWELYCIPYGSKPINIKFLNV